LGDALQCFDTKFSVVITNNNETIVCDDIPPVVCKQHDKTALGQAKKIAIFHFVVSMLNAPSFIFKMCHGT